MPSLLAVSHSWSLRVPKGPSARESNSFCSSSCSAFLLSFCSVPLLSSLSSLSFSVLSSLSLSSVLYCCFSCSSSYFWCCSWSCYLSQCVPLSSSSSFEMKRRKRKRKKRKTVSIVECVDHWEVLFYGTALLSNHLLVRPCSKCRRVLHLSNQRDGFHYETTY